MTQLDTSPLVQAAIPVGTWNVDPAHSSIEFGIRHLLITTVKGQFGDFEAAIHVADDGTASAEAVIRAASIDTNEPTRDEHLRSEDFFAAEQFPEIRFQSKSIDWLDETHFRAVGDLTIRGTTRAIELDGTFAGVTRDPWGNDRAGLTLTGHLNPNDYGVDWNQELETGGNMVGDRVDFTANVAAVKAA